MKKFLIVLIVLVALAVVGFGGYWFVQHQAKSKLAHFGITKTAQGGYTFVVDGKPTLIKGVCYNPIPVGKDYEYDFWSDPTKPWLEDGKLMKAMGVNAVRIYRVGKNPESVKQVINDLYYKFGIRSFVGDYLGFWDWPPADYSSPSYQEKIKNHVLEIIKTYKDEPGIAGWILGNENNYSFDRNIRVWTNDQLDTIQDPEELRQAKAKIYYKFVDDIAAAVKKLDAQRPIIMGIGEVKSLDAAVGLTDHVDVLGIIAYRGATFGNLFNQVREIYNKPILMIEYGADRFNAFTREEDQENQARFVELQWKDIYRNSTEKLEKGNLIGGFVFEWSDEWWKANENLAHTWSVHDETAQWSNSSYYYDYEAPGHMNVNEEWWGIVGIKTASGDNKAKSDLRMPKKAYYALKDAWTRPND